MCLQEFADCALQPATSELQGAQQQWQVSLAQQRFSGKAKARNGANWKIALAGVRRPLARLRSQPKPQVVKDSKDIERRSLEARTRR